MAMTQKILATHAGLDHVEARQLIEINLNVVLGDDIIPPVAIKELRKYSFSRVFDPGKISVVMDRFAPNKDIRAVRQCRAYHIFTYAKSIGHFYDVGEMGIEHALLPGKGIVGPGEYIIGADSHTCTYEALNAFSTDVGNTDMATGMATGKCQLKIPEAIKFDLRGKLAPHVDGKNIILYIIDVTGVNGALYKSMEFSGTGLQSLNMDDRLCMANMAIEAGTKNEIFASDEIMEAYVKDHVNHPYVTCEANADAEYRNMYHLDLSQIAHTVTFPHPPENTRAMDEIKGPVRIGQVVIGPYTDRWLFGTTEAAQILKGRYVAEGVRIIIAPVIQEIYKQCIQLGYMETFADAGYVVSTPTCGPYLGDRMGILAKSKRCVTTMNRSFIGQVRHVDSEVCLVGQVVAAASAVMGRITTPKEVT